MAKLYKRLAFVVNSVVRACVRASVDPRKLFATPFEKGVEYSQVSLSHNDNNSDTLCTSAYTLMYVEVKIKIRR